MHIKKRIQKNSDFFYSLSIATALVSLFFIILGLYKLLFKLDQLSITLVFTWICCILIILPFILSLLYGSKNQKSIGFPYDRKTSSNEWFLFCNIPPLVVMLFAMILSEFNIFFLFYGFFISYTLFWWLFSYDIFFIKNGFKINLFEKVRISLNKKDRPYNPNRTIPFLSATDKHGDLLFLYSLSVGPSTLIIFIIAQLETNYYLLVHLSFFLSQVIICVIIIHKIWSKDEIITFLYGNTRKLLKKIN